MKTSIVGTLSEAKGYFLGPNSQERGYTFIELTIVIMLIGLTLVLTVPRFRYALLTDDLRSTVRQMVGTIRSLRNEAVRKHQVYNLHFDLESDRFWIASAEVSDEQQTEAQTRTFQIPKGVQILDVWRKHTGKEEAGETAIRFTERGYIEPSVIHLGAQDGRKFTLILSPFLGKVKVLEEYVDFVSL